MFESRIRWILICLPVSRVCEEAAYRAPIHCVTDDRRRRGRNNVPIARPLVRSVFNDWRNLLYDKSASFRCDGRLFYSLGPAAANAPPWSERRIPDGRLRSEPTATGSLCPERDSRGPSACFPSDRKRSSLRGTDANHERQGHTPDLFGALLQAKTYATNQNKSN